MAITTPGAGPKLSLVPALPEIITAPSEVVSWKFDGDSGTVQAVTCQVGSPEDVTQFVRGGGNSAFGNFVNYIRSIGSLKAGFGANKAQIVLLQDQADKEGSCTIVDARNGSNGRTVVYEGVWRGDALTLRETPTSGFGKEIFVNKPLQATLFDMDTHVRGQLRGARLLGGSAKGHLAAVSAEQQQFETIIRELDSPVTTRRGRFRAFLGKLSLSDK